MALERNDKVECFVDEMGCYTRNMGYFLEGHEVLNKGQDKAIELLKKHIVHSTTYVHTYPYDWRTKQVKYFF